MSDSNNLGRKLLDLRERIDNLKEQKARLQGQIEAQEKKLKDDFGCSNLGQAKEKFTELAQQVQDLTADLTDAIEKLEEETGVLEST